MHISYILINLILTKPKGPTIELAKKGNLGAGGGVQGCGSDSLQRGWREKALGLTPCRPSAEQAGSLGEQGGKAEATGPLSAKGDAPFCISTALLLSFVLSSSNSPTGSSNATLPFYRRQDQGSQAISPRSNSSNAKPGTLASEPPPTSTTLCRRLLKDAQPSLTESLLDRKKTRQWGFISFDP